MLSYLYFLKNLCLLRFAKVRVEFCVCLGLSVFKHLGTVSSCTILIDEGPMCGSPMAPKAGS